MPLLLCCDELKPGMRLCETIIYRGRALLTGGKQLTHADIDTLRRSYPNVRARIGDPILDNVVEFEDDSREREVAATAQQRIAHSMSEVSRRFSSRAALGAMDVRAAQDSVTEVLKFLRENPVSAALLNRNLEAGSPISENAGNVFYLSMILGSAVRDYVSEERQRSTACRWLDYRISMDLLPLGMGAMFCDLGMHPLKHLYSSTLPLTPDDRKRLLLHPAKGADLLPADFAPAARAVIRTHHENFDGTGYPAGLAGHRIHVFARITRIADAYNAATASHLYKEAKSPARALWEMSCGSYRHYYDPTLMKVFTRLIQPFPIGAKLLLNDGRFAVVVKYNRVNPFLPVVIVAFDEQDRRLPNERLEGPLCLGDRPDLRIEAFGDESLTFLYEPSPDYQEIVSPEHFRSLFDAVFP